MKKYPVSYMSDEVHSVDGYGRETVLAAGELRFTNCYDHVMASWEVNGETVFMCLYFHATDQFFFSKHPREFPTTEPGAVAAFARGHRPSHWLTDRSMRPAVIWGKRSLKLWFNIGHRIWWKWQDLYLWAYKITHKKELKELRERKY